MISIGAQKQATERHPVKPDDAPRPRLRRDYFLFASERTAACAAARRAIGTRNGEQLT